jgi:hypothetical protein
MPYLQRTLLAGKVYCIALQNEAASLCGRKPGFVVELQQDKLKISDNLSRAAAMLDENFRCRQFGTIAARRKRLASAFRHNKEEQKKAKTCARQPA